MGHTEKIFKGIVENCFSTGADSVISKNRLKFKAKPAYQIKLNRILYILGIIRSGADAINISGLLIYEI